MEPVQNIIKYNTLIVAYIFLGITIVLLLITVFLKYSGKDERDFFKISLTSLAVSIFLFIARYFIL